MSYPNSTEIVIAIATTVVVAGAAAWAVKKWRRSLKSQCADECIGAATNLLETLSRCLDRKKNSPESKDEISLIYRQTWDAWWRFHSAFRQARRYQDLSETIPNEIADQLSRLKAILDQDWSKEQSASLQADQFQEAINQLLKPVTPFEERGCSQGDFT